MSETRPAPPTFGSAFSERMAVASYRDNAWTDHEIVATAPLSIHPAAHVFHYASTCFEGFKAYRWDDGSTRIFRLDRHIQRMIQSAGALRLPEPEPEHLQSAVCDIVSQNRDDAPEFPGALYVRPTLIGTLENIGAAASPSTEALLFILTSPVGDYFAGGARPLRIVISEEMRTTGHLGMVKTGGNYASALGPTLDAQARYGADQVLFCPGGEIQETGAANFLLIRDGEILTRGLDSTFLHGVTRDSILTLAADFGYSIREEVPTVDELLEWVRDGEAALSGTAAVLSGIGTLVYRGEEITVGNGQIGPHTQRLRNALVEIQGGRAADNYGWLESV
jgi:branched-chain amino acid aminotransferase